MRSVRAMKNHRDPVLSNVANGLLGVEAMLGLVPVRRRSSEDGWFRQVIARGSRRGTPGRQADLIRTPNGSQYLRPLVNR